jgi:hypothetical protein
VKQTGIRASPSRALTVTPNSTPAMGRMPLLPEERRRWWADLADAATISEELSEQLVGLGPELAP